MRKLLSLLTVVSLLLGSMPSFVMAQSQPNGDDGAANRALLPLISESLRWAKAKFWQNDGVV